MINMSRFQIMENRIDYIWLNDTSEQIICPSCLKSFPLEDRSDDPDKRYEYAFPHL